MRIELARAVPRLKRLLPALRKVRVAVLGDLMLDRYLWGTANRLSPEADVPVVNLVSQSSCLGGAGNVAANLAALGAQVECFGVLGGVNHASGKVGDDQAGSEFRACLRRANIENKGVFPEASRITTVKTRVIARQQIVRIDWERRKSLARASEEKLFRLLVASMNRIDALLISDYDKGLITDGFADRVLNACHKWEVPVFVKPNPRHFFCYRGARAVVCNTPEAEVYLTHKLDDEKALEQAGRVLLDRFGSAALVITRGKKGMSIFEETSPKHLNIPATSFEITYARVGQPAIKREESGRQVFDVTGAGDTVLGVLSLAIAGGADVPEAAYLANVAAGIVVGKLGTAHVSPAELAARLNEN